MRAAPRMEGKRGEGSMGAKQRSNEIKLTER